MDNAAGQLKELLATTDLPALGPGPRAGVRTETELNRTLDSTLRATGLSESRQQLVRSLLLLWHDQLDASHQISQNIEDADGSLVHAIMHRREPDYWNSKYWWRRVGSHPAYPEIAKRVERLLQEMSESKLAKKLVPGGKWDPYAFVDECEAAAASGSGERTQLLREIQRVESEAVLEYLLRDS
jgi:hypothetical protein